jgi:hypothetical protein
MPLLAGSAINNKGDDFMSMKKRVLSVLLAAVLALGFAVPIWGSDVYVVRDGDVLWRIARDHGFTWQELAEYNNLRNPHLILVGQQIRIPATATEAEVATELTEYEVTLGSKWPVGGTLSIPAGASERNPVPAVILVHGSGASDRDSTLFGVNRPFLDIAEHLSANGIAVLRYDKATYIHGFEMGATYGAAFTVWEETIETALYAAELLRSDPRIGKVYIAGLSLGGMLAPRIHAEGGNFDGFILMAGSPRTMMDISLDQNWMNVEIAYMQVAFQAELLLTFAESGEIDILRIILADTAEALGMNDIMGFTEEEVLELTAFIIDLLAAELDNIITSVEGLEALYAAIPYMTAEEARQILIDPFGGLYAYYMWDMALNPADVFLRTITAPFLIMQGSNDFQVFAEIDFAQYYALLGDRDNVTFMLYEGLNHLFMPSAATDLLEALEEYAIPQRVHPRVLSDIVEWIFAQR